LLVLRQDRARDVAEIARHERQHAGREEREQARDDRDGDRGPESSCADELLEAHAASSRTSSTSVLSTEGESIALMMRAATRPSRSSTRVIGVACRGVAAAKASFASPLLPSMRLG